MEAFGKGETPRVESAPWPELRPMVGALRQMIEQRRQWEAQQHRLSRLEGWRAMARQVVHEIRNAIMPFKLILERMRFTQRSPEQIQQDVQILLTHIERLEKLSTSFSQAARLPDVQPRPLHLGQWLQQWLESNPIEQVHVLQQPDSVICADPEALDIVLRNIVKNALEAHAQRIEITPITKGNLAGIAIQDDGYGMDTATLARLFEPDFTTKSSGMGAGMAIVRQLMEKMDGEIDVESEPGRGTTVWLWWQRC